MLDAPSTESSAEPAPFDQALLPVRHQDVAPDGSLVRILTGVKRGGMAHFELAVGDVSRAQRHRTVDEIWFIVNGLGVMSRWQGSSAPKEIDLRPGVALTIPVGTSFQFRNTGRVPLAAVGVTMPPWPGKSEAMEVAGVWEPRVTDPSED